MFESLTLLSDIAYSIYNRYQVKSKIVKWSNDGKYIGEVSIESPKYKNIVKSGGYYYSPNKENYVSINKNVILIYENQYYKELHPDGNTKIFREYEDNTRTKIRHTQYWDQDGNEKSIYDYFYGNPCDRD